MKNHPLKVALDVSCLGQCHIVPEGKTGVSRVIDRVFHGLNHSPEIDLSVSAIGSLHGVTGFLREQAPNALELIHPPSARSIAKVNAAIDSVAQKLLKHCSSPTALKFRLSRGILPTGSPAGRHFEGLDVFHSPFYPVPDSVNARGSIRKFLTIYDLIAVTQKQFMTGGLQRLMGEILESITPETWILCISGSTRRDLLNYLPHIDPQRVIVTPLAADEELFYPSRDSAAIGLLRAKYGIGQSPYILSICTLEPRKNLQSLLRSFIALKQSGSCAGLKLVLAGGRGWMIDALFADIKNSGAYRGDVIITGYIPDQELAALYSNALVFVYVSLYEGFGLPPLEAMQCGAPVITSNVSSLPEVVGDAGLTLDPHDIDGLSQGIISIYESEDRRLLWKRQSIERAQTFSWKKTIDATIRAYRLALDS